MSIVLYYFYLFIMSAFLIFTHGTYDIHSRLPLIHQAPPLRLQKLSVRLKSLMREKYSAANVLHLTTIGISGERVYAAKRLHRNRSNSLQNVMPALPFAAAESPGV